MGIASAMGSVVSNTAGKIVDQAMNLPDEFGGVIAGTPDWKARCKADIRRGRDKVAFIRDLAPVIKLGVVGIALYCGLNARNTK